jgi:phosphoglycolate phosphatase
MRHEAVLFDMDGTLLDTLEDLADSMNAVLAGRGFPVHPVAAYKQFVGLGMAKLIEQALPPEAGGPEVRKECLKEMTAAYGERWDRKTRLYPGIAGLLTELTARRIGLAILSNKPDEFTRIMAERYFSAWHFGVVLGAREGFPRKPDPAAALEISMRLAVPPERILYVGDTGTDMRTARGAGMTAVGVLWGFRDESELAASGARTIIREPAELLGLL